MSDNLYAIDVEKGAIIWKKHLENSWTPSPGGRGAGILCPGGLIATPVIGPSGTLTGKEHQIASWNHWSELSVANGRVYIGTFDSVYCFGGQK